MKKEMLRTISAFLSAVMLAVTAMPAFAAESAPAEPDFIAVQEETAAEASETPEADPGAEEQDTADEASAELDEETTDPVFQLMAAEDGRLLYMDFDGPDDVAGNILSLGKQDDSASFTIVDGAEADRQSNVLRIDKTKGGTGQKMTLGTWEWPAAAGKGERYVVTSFEIASKNVPNEQLEFSFASGDSGKNIAGMLKLNKGSIQCGQNGGSGDLKAANSGSKYTEGQWNQVSIVSRVSADDIVTDTVYYLNGIKQSVGTATPPVDAQRPTKMRFVFDKDTTNAVYYMDNISVTDYRCRLDYLDAQFQGADAPLEVAEYVPKDADSLQLPAKYEDADVIWTSDSSSITINGSQAAVTHGADSAQVTLTAKLRYQGTEPIQVPDVAVDGTAEKTYRVVVEGQNVSGDRSEAEKAKLALTLDIDETAVDFQLPDHSDVIPSAKITWAPKTASPYIAVDGYTAKVTRPSYKGKSQPVQLTATITVGDATVTKDFTVTILKNEGPVTDEEYVGYAYDVLLKTLGMEEGAVKTTSLNLNLPSSIEQASIQWTSSDESILTSDGIIRKRPAKGEGNYSVQLKAVISCGTESRTCSFELSISPAVEAKAFPGAQGYGTQTRGGAGGYVVRVTTLAAQGPGSLKEALEEKTGARIVIFDVGGTIDLTPLGRALQLRGESGSNVTIAGQTAPGDGIQLKGYGLNMSSVHDVILRNISIRIGNVRKAGDTYQSDPMSVSGSNKRVVIDHVSMCWGVDMGFRVYGEEITFSNNMISKGLYWNTPHEKGAHNYAGIFGPKYGSFYNNYIADCGQRAPRINDNEYIDVRNNLTYNSKYSFDVCNYEWMGANTKYNIVNNASIYGNPAPAGATGNTSTGGSFKYFQGRSYSGGIMAYSVNNFDNNTEARDFDGSNLTGAIWKSGDKVSSRDAQLKKQMKAFNSGQYSNLASPWRNMIFPDDISLEDYDASDISKKGNTLMNYPFPAPDMITRDTEEAVKYVLENASAKGPVRGTLDNQYLAQGRTRLNVTSDYSKASKTQGIRLTDTDIAKLNDMTSAYGLPLHIHTIYEDENKAVFYDVDGLNVTDTKGLTVKEQYYFVNDEENDLDSLYVKSADNKSKYRVVLQPYEDEDGIFDKFEVYDVNNVKLKKPDNYASVNSTSGIAYSLDGKTVRLQYPEWGAGPGNYKKETVSDDPDVSGGTVDTEWSEEDWPQLPEISRGSAEDKKENPGKYVQGQFDSNQDGIPDFYVRLMGWDKHPDYSSSKDISRLDFEGRGYTNIEYYINDYCAGDRDIENGSENEPIEAENVRDGSDKYNTHRSHEILFNTVRRAKAKVFYCEGESFDLSKAEEVALNTTYDYSDPAYKAAKDFGTYFSAKLPTVSDMTDTAKALKPATTYTYRIQTYSDTGVEAWSKDYRFTTEAEAAGKPAAPRILRYTPFDKTVTFYFEPAAAVKSYSQEAYDDTNDGKDNKDHYLTTISASQYQDNVDHYVLRYSTDPAMTSGVKEIQISGSAVSYTVAGLENEKDYYFDLRAVSADGQESDPAVYNAKRAEKLDSIDQDGNQMYGVKGLQLNSSQDQVLEYFYDTQINKMPIQPTKYVVAEDYPSELAKAEIGEGDTTKYITYYGDVKDWYIYTLGGIPIPSYRDGKLMLMLRDDSYEHGFTYAKKFSTPLTGKATIHCKLLIHGEELDPMNQSPELRFYLQQDSAYEETAGDEGDSSTVLDNTANSFGNIITLQFTKNELLYNGESITRYEGDTWYDIKLLMDANAKTCSLYINDSLVGEDLEYIDEDAPGTIARWQISSRLAGAEDVYIEYMYASNGHDEDDSVEDPIPERPGTRPASGGGAGGGGGGKVDPIPTPTATPAPEDPNKPGNTDEPIVIKDVFKDMDNYEWAREAVNRLYAKEIVTGIGEECYAPDQSVTREQYITMLMRVFELIGNDAVCSYTDVEDGAWYYPAIAMASAMGIVKGMGDGSFGIGQQISRQDMAVMAKRLIDCIGMELPDKRDYQMFADNDAIAQYAAEAVTALYQGEIINGMSENLFQPGGTANRAQAAVIIDKLLESRLANQAE